MFRIGILLIFLAVPLAEIALLIQLSHWIGTLATIALVILTAVVGTALLRQQGLRTLLKVNEQLSAGQAPVVPVVEGILLIVSGAFLLTPGVITDSIGGVLLIGPAREAIAGALVRVALNRGFVHVSGTGPGRPDSFRTPNSDDPFGRQHPKRTAADDIIEGEYERIDEKTVRPRRGNDT